MRVLDLFSGIGGFSLGLKWAGMETVQFCEIDPWCHQVLAKNFPGIPIHDDIRTFNATAGSADLVCGGFPCQPFSHAGKRLGKADDRDLWPEMRRVIAAIRPTWVIGENVVGFVRMELDRSLADLEALGYACQALVIPACAVDAPHRRDRVWIIAHADRSDGSAQPESQHQGTQEPDGDRKGRVGYADSATHADRDGGGFVRERLEEHSTEQGPQGGEPDRLRARGRRDGAVVADARCLRGEIRLPASSRGSQGQSGIPNDSGLQGSRSAQWLAEPAVGGNPDGLPLWLDRFVGWGMSYEESRHHSSKTLRAMWNADVSQALWRAVGGLDRFLQAQVLFAVLRQYAKDPHETRLFMARPQALEELVRSVRRKATTARSSRRSGQGEQSAGEHPDVMQVVPQLSALDGETPWACNGWEDGIARVSTGVSNRVHRLRGLGNSVVPQVVEVIGRAIMEAAA